MTAGPLDPSSKKELIIVASENTLNAYGNAIQVWISEHCERYRRELK